MNPNAQNFVAQLAVSVEKLTTLTDEVRWSKDAAREYIRLGHESALEEGVTDANTRLVTDGMKLYIEVFKRHQAGIRDAFDWIFKIHDDAKTLEDKYREALAAIEKP